MKKRIHLGAGRGGEEPRQEEDAHSVRKVTTDRDETQWQKPRLRTQTKNTSCRGH